MGHTEVVKSLYKKFEQDIVPLRNGWTPIMLSVAPKSGNLELFKFLASKITQGSPNDSYANGWTPMHEAAQNGHTEIVSYLTTILEFPNCQRIHTSGKETPIFLATTKDNWEIVKILFPHAENISVIKEVAMMTNSSNVLKFLDTI